MPDEEKDPIADTGMFRAFVAKGEAERSEPKSMGAPVIIAAVLAVLVLATVIWLLVS